MSLWLINAVGILAGITGTICWLPQLVKTIRTRETRDLSLWTNVLLLVTILLWLVYAFATSAWPMVASNIIGVINIGVLVALKLRHG